MADYSVTFQHSEATFTVQSNEMILDAAIRQGVSIPYVCRNGTCRTCMYQVKDGKVNQLDAEDCSISEQELEMGRRLLCLSVCKSDVILDKVKSRRLLEQENQQKMG